jgi:hypothetical protein
MEELKNLSMEELCIAKKRIEQEIEEREDKEFKEDCKILADTLREFLERGHELHCYIDVECYHCDRNTDIDLWDYIENIIDDLERNYM